jgi:hypothetical protein
MTPVVGRRLAPLAHAAFAAELDYQALRGLLLRGVVEGELRGRSWFVDLVSLQAYTRQPLRPLPEAGD